MQALDWGIIAVYLLGMVGYSAYLGRRHTNEDDYYVSGRALPWWAVGISTMATQTGVISFISIPAFVAIKQGGGLTWLQYELAVPLAMIFVMVVLIPFFRKLELISVYEYLEMRFGTSVRLLMSAVFLLSRGLATGVSVYATALVLQVCLDLPLWSIILLIGGVTIVYDTLGGMTAVVYTDVIQVGVLLVGLAACNMVAIDFAGGVDNVVAALEPGRWQGVQMASGLGDGTATPFWAFLVGGFFLYASYYGVDQSQAQRELSARTTADTKRSLVFNGLVRFPLTLAYIALGVSVGAVYGQSEKLRGLVPADKLDQLVPQFIVNFLPQGVRALAIAAMLAAAMSSLDSALNSLSASTLRDFIGRKRQLSPKRMLLVGKLTTVAWGVLITAFAFVVGNISETVLESINKIGSAFYGPILASFVVGVLSLRANAPGVITGVCAGVGVNLMLWFLAPGVHWMWWNFVGFVVASLVAELASRRLGPGPVEEHVALYTLRGKSFLQAEGAWLPTYGVLVAYGLLILLTAAFAYKLVL